MMIPNPKIMRQIRNGKRMQLHMMMMILAGRSVYCMNEFCERKSNILQVFAQHITAKMITSSSSQNQNVNENVIRHTMRPASSFQLVTSAKTNGHVLWRQRHRKQQAHDVVDCNPNSLPFLCVSLYWLASASRGEKRSERERKRCFARRAFHA